MTAIDVPLLQGRGWKSHSRHGSRPHDADYHQSRVRRARPIQAKGWDNGSISALYAEILVGLTQRTWKRSREDFWCATCPLTSVRRKSRPL